MTLLFSLCQFLSILCKNQSCWHFGKVQRFLYDNFSCHGAGDISGITTKINDRGRQTNIFFKDRKLQIRDYWAPSAIANQQIS
jgi:hypothetical protein